MPFQKPSVPAAAAAVTVAAAFPASDLQGPLIVLNAATATRWQGECWRMQAARALKAMYFVSLCTLLAHNAYCCC
jgi:hypothetical protein